MKVAAVLRTLLLSGALALTVTGADRGTTATTLNAGELPRASQQLKVTVDGAINPGGVPDDVAFSLFFRMLDRVATERERSQLRAYIDEAYSFGKHRHHLAETDATRDLRQQRADRLIEFIETYKPDIDRIDASKHTDPAYAARRATLVATMRSTLAAQIGAEDAVVIDTFVREVVKRRIRAYGR
jgi:hypothetical protein